MEGKSNPFIVAVFASLGQSTRYFVQNTPKTSIVKFVQFCNLVLEQPQTTLDDDVFENGTRRNVDG